MSDGDTGCERKVCVGSAEGISMDYLRRGLGDDVACGILGFVPRKLKYEALEILDAILKSRDLGRDYC